MVELERRPYFRSHCIPTEISSTKHLNNKVFINKPITLEKYNLQYEYHQHSCRPFNQKFYHKRNSNIFNNSTSTSVKISRRRSSKFVRKNNMNSSVIINTTEATATIINTITTTTTNISSISSSSSSSSSTTTKNFTSMSNLTTSVETAVIAVTTSRPSDTQTTTNIYSPDNGVYIIANETNLISELDEKDNMNLTITPALSQILLPTTSSGPGSFTTASNNGNETLNSFFFFETEQFILLWILFTVIVLGNSAVLVTLFLNKNRKSRMNFFIKQLAIADLCVGLLNLPVDIIWRTTISWRAGNFACKLIKFVQATVTYASTYVLVALSIDRYDAITHPMNFSGSWKRARRLVIAAWAFSAFFSLPMLFLYEETLIEKQTQCWIELGEAWRWQLWMSLVSTAVFVIPALIISACYAIIVRTIWAKGAIYTGPADRNRGSNGNGSAGGFDRDCRRASSRGIIPRAKVKTVKMTIVIVIVFVLCWSPYIIFDLLQVFQQIPKTQTNMAIASLIQSLAPLNSAANPIIYCLFSTHVGQALKRIPPFRWIISALCCKSASDTCQTTIRCSSNGHRLNNSNDSTRTFTTSLTVSRRSTSYRRPVRVVFVDRPKTILALSEV